jgi:hypothetical protein
MSTPHDRLEDDRRARELPSSLWNKLRADPVRAPEHLALAAADRHGPAAAAWVADKRRMYSHGGADLAQMAKKRHAALARFGGAAGGVGGIVTMVPDLAALAWIQSRLVFFVAAAYGFDPTDRMRPAELLVLQGLYAEPRAAREALDGAGRTVAEAYIGSRLQRDEQLASRLLKMVGKKAATRVAGRMIPLFAIGYNAINNERETRALADQAIRFYGG